MPHSRATAEACSGPAPPKGNSAKFARSCPFSVETAPGFNLCLQWHPEWQAAANPVSMQLLTAFGDATRAWQALHHSPHRNPIP